MVVVGPGLCSEDYNSHSTHCHHPSASDVWYILESYTVGILAPRQGKELGEGLKKWEG